MGKIFAIGLNKTGTRSLAEALRTLGFRTLHKGDPATSAMVENAVRDGVPLLSYIGDRYDAYLDVESLVRNFRLADQQYPGSRFILTTRALEAWLDSREKHVRANQRRAQEGAYHGKWLDLDRDQWIVDRERHHEAVLGYFRGRPNDLLIMDVSRGDGWEVLAPFLGCTVPAVPFPWANRDGAGTYASRAAPRLRLLQQTVRRVHGKIRYRGNL